MFLLHSMNLEQQRNMSIDLLLPQDLDFFSFSTILDSKLNKRSYGIQKKVFVKLLPPIQIPDKN